MILQPTSPRPLAPDAPVIPGAAIEPLYVKTLSESVDADSVVLSPDGNTLWVLVESPVIDVGALINQHALACASTIAAVLTLILLVWLRRASRRRRTVGALHCRRCDYNVTGIGAGAAGCVQPTVCPECGVDLLRRRPRPGRSALRRLGLPLTLLAAVLLSFGWFAVFGRKAYPAPMPQWRWGSLTLSRWSSVPWLAWMQKATAHGELLLELDTQTGVTRRVIAARPSRSYFQMEYNPVAQAVYLRRGAGDIDLVSVRNGRTIATIHDQAAASGGSRVPFVVGHSADWQTVYLNCGDARTGTSWLGEWNWRTGESRRIGATKGRSSAPPHHTPVPGERHGGMRVLRYTDFMESFQSKHYRLTLLDESGAVLKERDLGESVSSMGIPSFSRDASLIFLPSQYGADILAFDSATLQDAASLSIGLGTAQEHLPVSEDGRFMLIGGNSGIFIRDMAAKAWGPKLSFDHTVYAPHSIRISADGRTVCCTFQSNSNDPSGRTRGFTHPIGVWRLPEPPALKSDDKPTAK